MSILSKPYFHDEEAAFAHLEGVLWPNGPVCPHCGGMDRITKVKANPEKRIRVGLWRCGDCKRQFTVKVGTVFEHGRIPLHKFLQAVHLLCCSKKGVSSHQLHRILEVQYKTAWFLTHRIREAMRSGDLTPFGAKGGFVEVDETFLGRDRSKKADGEKRGRGTHHKFKVLTLVDRDSGQARSEVINELNAKTIAPIVRKNLAREAKLMTDEARYYASVGVEYGTHGVVRHSIGEYGYGEFHTNTIEGYFSIFKRGMKDVYQHCSEKHLHRYLAEFDFRYSHRAKLGVKDQERTEKALSGIAGKRLTYAN